MGRGKHYYSGSFRVSSTPLDAVFVLAVAWPFRAQEKVQRIITKRRDKNGKVISESETMQDILKCLGCWACICCGILGLSGGFGLCGRRVAVVRNVQRMPFEAHAAECRELLKSRSTCERCSSVRSLFRLSNPYLAKSQVRAVLKIRAMLAEEMGDTGQRLAEDHAPAPASLCHCPGHQSACWPGTHKQQLFSRQARCRVHVETCSGLWAAGSGGQTHIRLQTPVLVLVPTTTDKAHARPPTKPRCS